MTDLFLKEIRLLGQNKVSIEALQQAKNCFIDYLAVTISGSKEFSYKVIDYIQSYGYGSMCSTVIGVDKKTDMQTAALINGMNSHVLELDDGHRQGALHIGSTIFSALLAVAEKEDLSIEDFIYGAIIGYEVTVRLACAVHQAIN